MDSIELRKPAARGAAKLWSISRKGAKLTTVSGSEGKPQKSSVETHADADEATRAFDKAMRAKMRDGYALISDRASAKPGSLVFAGFAAGGGGGLVADVSRDGRFALTAGHRGAPVAVWVELIDTLTGARRVVFERAHPRQLFLHSADFDHTGDHALITVDNETFVVELATGATRTVAKYGGAPRGVANSNFNPHVLRPSHDRARKRWCVFDAKTVVRVLDERLATVCEIPLEHPTTELRAASVSPDGTLIALYRVSRSILYGQDDAKDDQTQQIEIRRSDNGALVNAIDVARAVTSVTLTPDNKRLAVQWEHESGPRLLDAKTGRELAQPRGKDGREQHAFAWDFSLAGHTLAVGTYGLRLLDGASLADRSERLERWPSFDPTRYVSFCDDDRLLASGRPGAITLHRA
ncbi:MAG: hypothetical protein JNK05_07995 [Myxococcales bacterium]|nr:hypothetical protein [Myxococcales bacterium]